MNSSAHQSSTDFRFEKLDRLLPTKPPWRRRHHATWLSVTAVDKHINKLTPKHKPTVAEQPTPFPSNSSFPNHRPAAMSPAAVPKLSWPNFSSLGITESRASQKEVKFGNQLQPLTAISSICRTPLVLDTATKAPSPSLFGLLSSQPTISKNQKQI